MNRRDVVKVENGFRRNSAGELSSTPYEILSKCPRCKKEFKESELKKLSRVMSLPMAIIVSLNPQLRSAIEEGRKAYCGGCRRVLNLCLFFGVFLFVIFPTIVYITT